MGSSSGGRVTASGKKGGRSTGQVRAEAQMRSSRHIHKVSTTTQQHTPTRGTPTHLESLCIQLPVLHADGLRLSLHREQEVAGKGSKSMSMQAPPSQGWTAAHPSPAPLPLPCCRRLAGPASMLHAWLACPACCQRRGGGGARLMLLPPPQSHVAPAAACTVAGQAAAHGVRGQGCS